MISPELNLPIEVVSEDRNEYTLDAWRPTIDDLENLWKRYEKYNILFSDYTAGNKDYFNKIMLQKSTIILVAKEEDTEVGILYVTDIRTYTSADVHYFFWDKKTVGRQKVILAALDWCMREFCLHRVNTTVPAFAFSALHRIHCLGLRIEGYRKQAILSRGKWIDMYMFGVLQEELTEEALSSGKLAQTTEGQNWHGLLNNDPLLMRKILNRGKIGKRTTANTEVS